jgi:Alr-MurF fusion protein
LILNDTYSSDTESFLSAIDFIRQQSSGKPLGIILTDLEQQTSDREWLELIAEVIQTHQIKLFIGVGTTIRNLASKLQMPDISTFFFSNTTELTNSLHNLPFEGYALLCKGARSFKLEKIIAQLIAQSHAAVLEINLKELAYNFSMYTSMLSPDTEVMIMLKAFAYGSGDLELARFFESAGVSWFGVAFIDEGIKLRQGGIQTPILVLSPDPDSIHLCLTHRLDPEIYSVDQLIEILSLLTPHDKLNIHLKLDTGMHRLGLDKDDIPAAIELLKNTSNVKVVSVLTHMAQTSDIGKDSFVHIQMQRFETMYRALVSGIGYQPLRHAMNSDGIINFPEYHMELVRLGIGLYGVSGRTIHDISEEPVHTLKAKIVQVKEIQPGETVGYNRNWKAKECSKIATINIGYADGLMRKAGNGKAKFLIRNEQVSTVGNICMDMCMIDVTNISDVKPGDEVILFSKEHSVQKLSEACETIPYEILSRISSRISRLYLKD